MVQELKLTEKHIGLTMNFTKTKVDIGQYKICLRNQIIDKVEEYSYWDMPSNWVRKIKLRKRQEVFHMGSYEKIFRIPIKQKHLYKTIGIVRKGELQNYHSNY